MDVVNTEQAEFWASMAPTWVEVEDFVERTVGSTGEMAMDRLALEAGNRVLDLGCGTGRTTLELARRVAPSGEATGVDIADEMLERARRRAKDAGTANVTFLNADVQVQDLGESSFDAAFSRFGVMFFSDPVAAFANVRRALKPAGRLSFVCWQNVFANEWMLVPAMAVMSATGTAPTMPGEGEPGPFSLSDPDRLRSLLSAAGFSDIDVAEHNDHLVIDEAEIPDFAPVSTRMGAAREALKEADDATRQKAIQAVIDAMMAKSVGGQVQITRGFFVVGAKA